MSLLVVGLSHRSAPVSVLERAALSLDAQIKLLQDTVAAEPAAEAALLATCNRIELYADVDKFHAGVAELSTLLARHSGVGLDEITPYLYVHYEDRAVHHLFSVACGLDSMVVGEGQILGQIKDSLARAQELHTAGRLLNDLFQQSLRVGKRAHSETGIDRAGQSLVTFGLEQFTAGADVTSWARGKRAVVIGAGSMSSLAAATLARAGVGEIVIANRTYDRAERLARILTEQGETDVLARAVPMESVPGELTRADIAVSCTGATGLVLTAGMVAAAVEGRVPEGAPSRPAARPEIRTGIRAVLPPTSVGSDDDCPLDLPAVQGGGFSVHGEDAVAGMDAATLEQHAAWVDNATVDRRASRRTPEREAPRTPAADAELITALVAAVAVSGRITELRRPEAVVEVPRPAPVLALLDLAMPRDIDAAAHRLAGVRLVDIESLAEVSADAPMAADVDLVRRIVSDEVAAFGAAQRAAHITPTVVALRAMAADVVASEIARLEGRLPGLDDKHRGEITQTVRRVVDKLLHAPTVRVKQLAAEPGGAGYADALRTLFDLDQETVAAVSRAVDSDQRTAGGQFVGANAENRGRS
ncbi:MULTISPECIES: glutamyl-tRNA reductase [Streptomyces]|uniref:Glutamyl-tRNA reductase n=5 Tax=Streptomyces scabiei TaxID=1930 RepID=C9YZC5_STRSW|nr:MULTISPECIES: glutamyl-tRNA reductase [Streptomyces]KFG10497.1 glutamyl-tRNA reductase [Streptomyces scabiei]MBP5891779.1 glutamyl-tRNA reductase [Streptomyces sp. LBUM 1481]MBP5921935.1 glutamyl-tRNA reductase [Streptomyces sp. LBUM 1483]MDX2577318.1 glutamyl-tRNA reductase [Streptomyces scabiei]MDX2657197.1 glutamyl-tRNA reductase [Streptomyces scabiei]